MAAKPDIVAGTITLTTGSATFTGTDTFWQFADIQEGDTIIDVTGATEFMGVIETITDNTSGTLTKPWEGPTLTAEYRIRYMSDGQKVTAQARNLIELLGNGRLTAIASAPETVGVIEMLPGGAARLVPLTDLVSGANYDVQVANMAARAAFDGQTAGFAVLVADVGDGRAAIFSKLSNASGDWSAAAYVTGPIGESPDIAAGTTTTLAPGTPADVDVVPDGSGGYLVNFNIPAGEGFAFQGAYDIGTAYNKGDVVRYNNSAWIALQATTGNAPPVLPTTANANWELLAAKGADGTGTGDVVGPAGAVADRIAVFSGTTGKLIKDGGATIAELTPADGSVTNAKLANMAQSTIKGRAAGAGTGAPVDLAPAQVSTVLRPDRVSFRAHKNGTSQTGIPTGVGTKVTFPTEVWDTGGYYDASTSRFTPPAGKYRLTASMLTVSGAVDQAAFGPLIFKNGVQDSSCYDAWSGTVNKAANISVLVTANGTDYFEVFFEGFGAGDKGLNGAATATWFCGEEL